MKRFFVSLGLAILLMVVLSLGLCANAEVYSGECGAYGDNVTWSLDTETGVLTISGVGKMSGYYISSSLSSNANPPWKSHSSYIKTAFIGDGVTSIGSSAFNFCTNLIDVTIGNNVTSIFDYAFENCTSLTSINIPNSVTSIGDRAFYECTSLTSVSIPDSVTSIGWDAFYGCSKLTSIDIPDNVTNIQSGTFYRCKNLVKVTIGDGIKHIEKDAFEGCEKLAKIIVSKNNMCYSNDEQGALFSKDKTTLIQYPIGNIATEYEIPNSVTSIGDGAFEYCTSLEKVTIGNSVSSIGDRAFYYCNRLRNIEIPDSVINIGSDAFAKTAIYNTAANWYNDNELYIDNCLVAVKSTPTEIKYGTRLIASLSLSCSSIILPDTIECISDEAFGSKIASVTYNGLKSDFAKISIGYSNSYFNKATVNFRSVSPTGLTLSENAVTLVSGTVAVLSAKLAPENATDKRIIWSSNDEAVATVKNGVVTAVAGGEAVITATTYDGSISAECAVTVIPDRDIVLVLDNSGSMGGSVAALQSAAKSFCDTILGYDDTNIALVVFGSSTSTVSFTRDSTVLDSKISALDASGGGTDTAAAIRKAAELLATSAAGSKNIVLMSDGVPNSVDDGKVAADELDETYNVYTLGFALSAGSTAEEFLKYVASTDNHYYSANDEESLNKAFKEIGTSIIEVKVTGISLEHEIVALFPGETSVLNYTIEPYNAISREVTFTSSNADVVTVCNGEIAAVDYGQAIITVTTSDGNFTAECLVSVEPIDNWYYTYAINADGTASISGYRPGMPSDVVIPEYIQGRKATSIGNDAFYKCTSLTSISIPDSVISIGGSAFYRCTNLESINIPNSVISIGGSAFDYCNLESLYISDLSAWCNIDFTDSSSNPFYSGAQKVYVDKVMVSEIIIPNDITEIKNYTFSGLHLPIKIHNGVTNIGDGAFYRYRYNTLEIPGSVTNMGEGAFRWSSLKSIEIPDSVAIIGAYAFSDCYNLTDVTIGNSVTSIGNSVTSIGDSAFYDCYNLTDVTIGNSVTSVGGKAFRDCTRLTSINIPDSVTSIGSSAFSGCTSLTSISIPDSVTSIGNDAFYSCTSLTDVYANDIEAWLEISFADSFANPMYYADFLHILENGVELTEITIPNGVISIPEDAFKNAKNITSITIPASVTSIGNYAFRSCTSLASITIPNSVKSIGDYAFYGCTSLVSITIPNSVKSIGDNAFDDCRSLTSITIPDSVTSIGCYAFHYCTNLTDVAIGNSVISIGSFVFSYCTSLTDVAIGNSVTSISEYAFYYCRSLTSITIPDSVTSISSAAFSGCTSLTIYSKNPTAQTYATNKSYRYFSLDSNSDGNFTHADIEAVAKHISNTNNAIAMPTKGSVVQTVTLSDLRAITSHLIYLNQTK